MRIMYGFLIQFLLLLILMSGCAKKTKPIDLGFPNAYKSDFEIDIQGPSIVRYRVLGIGYGMSKGSSVLCGLIYSKSPDWMEAYNNAVKQRSGDFLIETRIETSTAWYGLPFIYREKYYFVWGIVAVIAGNEMPTSEQIDWNGWFYKDKFQKYLLEHIDKEKKNIDFQLRFDPSQIYYLNNQETGYKSSTNMYPDPDNPKIQIPTFENKGWGR